MANRLEEVRRAAHANLMQQARERVHKSLSGMHSNFLQNALHPHQSQQNAGSRPANRDLLAGNTAQAAQEWEQHHPGAMAGNAAIPGWVLHQLTQNVQSRVPQNAPSTLGSGQPTEGLHPQMAGAQPAVPVDVTRGFRPGGVGSLPGRGGIGTPVEHPTAMPVGNQMPMHQEINPFLNHPGSGFSEGLVPLGQGLYLHPVTGQIHGLGVQAPPQTSAFQAV